MAVVKSFRILDDRGEGAHPAKIRRKQGIGRMYSNSSCPSGPVFGITWDELGGGVSQGWGQTGTYLTDQTGRIPDTAKPRRLARNRLEIAGIEQICTDGRKAP
jgi:hypothetical protein